MNNIDVLKQIEKLCGNTTPLENGWHHFVYHHLHYVIIPDCRNDMIRISIPHICKDGEYGRKRLENVINEANREVKYIKVMILENGSISLNYDHKISDEERACDIVQHMIKTLYCASEYLMLKLQAQ
jgi:hypothetical protein